MKTMPEGGVTIVKIVKMMVEYLECPLGIDNHNFQFVWILDGAYDEKQNAYSIVLEKDDDIVWGTCVIQSYDTHRIYDGKQLESNSRYKWTLTIYGDKGSNHTMTSYFSTGLFRESDWKAQWVGRHSQTFLNRGEDSGNIIGLHEKVNDGLDVETRSILLRKTCDLPKRPKQAIAYICGLGLYEFYINGKKVGNKVLTPLITDYRKRVLYDTYDIKDLLVQGLNAICIELGNGCFFPFKPCAVIQIHIEFEDGTKQIITSDDSWKIADGAVVSNGLYDGEIYDAREEKEGWKLPEYDDNSWEFAQLVEPPGGRLVSNIYTSITVNGLLEPVKVRTTSKGIVYDFGVNIAGWVRVLVKGKRGTKLQIRYAEVLRDDETFDVKANLNSDIYILKGDEEEPYEPRFAFHRFRYVEVGSEPSLPEIIAIKACVVHGEVEGQGFFQCDNERINKMYDAMVHSQSAALVGIPVSCFQRGEGFSRPEVVYAAAEACMYNFNMALFYKKWLDDIKLQQDMENGLSNELSLRNSVEWGSVYSLMVWNFYQHYGDIQIIRNHYDRLKHYADFLNSQAKDYIFSVYFYYNIMNLVRMAEVIKNKEDYNFFLNIADDMKAKLSSRYYDPIGKKFGDDTQFSNAFALIFGLIPEEDEEAVLKRLIKDVEENSNYYLGNGILESKFVMDALDLYGMEHVAYKLMMRKIFPKRVYMSGGRIALSTRWKKRSSGNHYRFGSMEALFYKILAGIHNDLHAPGFKKVIIRPYIPKEFNNVSAKIQTIRGEVISEWKKHEDLIEFYIKIPFGTAGEFWLDKRLDIKKIRINDAITKSYNVSTDKDALYQVFTLNSGVNVFEVFLRNN